MFIDLSFAFLGFSGLVMFFPLTCFVLVPPSIGKVNRLSWGIHCLRTIIITVVSMFISVRAVLFKIKKEFVSITITLL